MLQWASIQINLEYTFEYTFGLEYNPKVEIRGQII
jgi:hypothetical protein